MKQSYIYNSVKSACLVLLATLSFNANAAIIFSENFGTPTANTGIAAYATGSGSATFQNKNTLTYSNGGATGSADVRSSSASSGYTGSSGSGNVFFTTTTTLNPYGFSIESINAANYTSITLDYAYRKESGTAHASFAIEFWDGSAWIPLANTSTVLFSQASNATTGWYTAKQLVLPAAAQINGLKIRFLKSGSLSIRIDDVVLSGTQSILGQNVISSGAGTEPATISSLTNTQAAAGLNFDFEVIEDGLNSAVDALDTKISQIVITQGTGNTVTNWLLAIAGAELTDGTNVHPAVISATDIKFTGIDIATLGLITDNGAKTYTLKIWLKSDMTTLKNTIDNKSFVFRVQSSSFTTDPTGSLFDSTQDQNSGVSLNTVSVVASQLNFVQQPSPSQANIAMTPAVTVSANDFNGNRDLDYVTAIDVTSTGMMSPSPSTEIPVAGFATFSNIIHTANGFGLNLTATSGANTGTSNTFDITIVTLPSDYFRSKVATGLWSDPMSWESSVDNITWMNSTLAPTSAANTIKILSGHKIQINMATTLDQTTVETGGELVSSSAPTLNDGAGDDLVIQTGAKYTHQGGSLMVFSPNTATFRMSSGADMDVISNSSSPATYANDLSLTNNMIWENAAVFNWNTTGTPAVSGRIYFPGVAATVVPIFRVSGTLTNPGGSSATTINGILDVRNSFSWAGTGDKIFRNGIINGSASSVTMTQAANSKFLIPTNNTELGGTNGLLTLSLNTQGVIITADNVNITSSLITTGTGAVNFAGTAAQTVNATGNTISKVAINNTNGVTLTSPLKVTDLILTAGKITLGANDLTVETSITGQSATSYIVTDAAGSLVRNVAAATGSYDLPVGTVADYQLANIDFTAAPATMGTLSAKFKATAPAGGTTLPAPLTVGATTIDAVAGEGTWEINESGLGMGLTYTATLNAKNFLVSPSQYANVALVKRPSASTSAGDWVGHAGSAAGTAPTVTITAAGLTSFSEFAVGAPATALPVTMSSFDVRNNRGDAILNWSTAMEKNSASFVIEHSTNNETFQSVGTVRAAGNSNIAKQYMFIHKAKEGVNYYRLKQIDADLRYVYTQVRSLYIGSKNTVNIINTLVNDELIIASEYKTPVQVEIYDMRGAMVKIYDVNQGITNTMMCELERGIYLVRMTQDNNIIATSRIVKQ